MKNESWTQKKIKGDIAESICKGHFELLGYDIDKIGIENIGQNYTSNFLKKDNKRFTDTLLKNNLNKIPDLLASRADGKSFMIEVKFRSEIKSFDALQNELYWTYRRMIYKDEFINSLPKEIEKHWDNDKLYEDPQYYDLIKQLIKRATRNSLRLPIYFYVVCRSHERLSRLNNEHEYVHLNYVEKPGFIPMGDKMFFSYAHYKNIDGTTSLHHTYFNEIKPLLDEVIGAL